MSPATCAPGRSTRSGVVSWPSASASAGSSSLPRATWLSDTDPAFYVACYLRAWALDAIWRRALVERFGDRWFEGAAAGDWLRMLWAGGQRLRADELLAETLGEELDFTALAAEFDSAG